MDPVTALLLAAAGYGGYRYIQNRRVAQAADVAHAEVAQAVAAQAVAAQETARSEAGPSPVRPSRRDSKGLFAAHIFDAT